MLRRLPLLVRDACHVACESPRKRNSRPANGPAKGPAEAGHYVLFVLLLFVFVGRPAQAVAQEPAPPPPAASEAPAAEDAHAAEEAHAAGEGETHEEGGVVEIIARLVNFAILAGTLFYLLRSPIATYLSDRGTQIRSDLVNAEEMKLTAAAQIEEIDRKMKALPGELKALRAQGATEIAAEQARIRAAAAAERDRLLEQARREIDQQVKIAERELVSHAADLAVGVAAERIKKTITDEDQKRLADRYVQQLKS